MKRPLSAGPAGVAAMTAFGVATLCLLAILGPLLSRSHTAVYHTSGPALTLFAAVLFDLSALWVLLTGMLLLARRPGRRQFAIWSAIVLALPWIVLKNASMLGGFLIPHWLNVSVPVLSLAVLVVLNACWRPSFLSAFERVRRLLTVIFAFVTLNGVLILGQLLWYAWQVRALSTPPVLHHRAVSSSAPPTDTRAAHPRVIWILLDELSFQQVYERRFPGLELPTFDAIARQSTVFTQVVAAGVYTEEAVPSLLTGLPVDRIRASSNGQRLFIHRPDTQSWLPFDPHQTIFQDALNDGYSTAVAGWYNPYCRILAPVLDRCFWTFQLPYPGGIVAGNSLASNALGEISHRFSLLKSILPGHPPESPRTALESELHIADYRELRDNGDSMLDDPAATFVFLHIPIPHPEGIYDRRHKMLTTGASSYTSSYIDNLALADRYLAHVRDLLQRRGDWDASTIVIMGDHSWRTSFLWSKGNSWTPEDQAASHGAVYDRRPAYIVKLPGQQQGSQIDAPFKAIHTRSLLDAVLAGQMHTAADLDAWVKQQR